MRKHVWIGLSAFLIAATFCAPAAQAQAGGFAVSQTACPATLGCSTTALTVANSSHASGSSVGGLVTFPFFRPGSTYSGLLNNVEWIWRTGSNTTAVTVYVFASNPTGSTCTDAVAVSIAAVDVPKQIPGSPFTLTPAVIGTGSSSSAAFQQSPIAMNNKDGSPLLYACVSVNTTVTPAANDAILSVGGLAD